MAPASIATVAAGSQVPSSRPRRSEGGDVARFEADVVIIGGGITAAMVADKLSELRPNWSVIVVEAGKRLFDADRRFEYRKRNLEYGEHMWPGDYVTDQAAR